MTNLKFSPDLEKNEITVELECISLFSFLLHFFVLSISLSCVLLCDQTFFHISIVETFFVVSVCYSILAME